MAAIKSAVTMNNPVPMLAKARAALDDIESKITAAVALREQRLGEDDDLGPLRLIDRDIEALRRDAGIHRERISVLVQRVAQQDLARREREKTAAIEKHFAPKLRQVDQLAADTETALRQFCTAYAQLNEAARSINREWPAAVPHPKFVPAFGLGDAGRRITRALERARTDSIVPRPDEAEFVAAAANRAGDVGAIVKRSTARFLESLRSEPVASPAAAA